MSANREPPRRPDTRRVSDRTISDVDFSPIAVIVGVVICAVAAAIYLNLGPFADPAPTAAPTPFKHAVTVSSQVSVHDKKVGTKTRLTVYAARKYALNKKHQRPVKVSVEVTNNSPVPLTLLGNRQSLETTDGRSATASSVRTLLPVGATRRIILSFLIAAKQKPRLAVLEIANKKTDFSLKF